MSAAKNNFSSNFARIIAVQTAVPPNKFTQQEICKLLNIQSEKSKRFFENPHIQTRHLCDFDESAEKNNASLLNKFKKNAVELGQSAIAGAVAKAGLTLKDVSYICCVTSTGFIVPGLSHLLSAKLMLNPETQKLDIVGMGCSAGINALAAASAWCRSNEGKYAVVLCCEISSSIYLNDDSESVALVNSLFGDGAVATVLTNNPTKKIDEPELLNFYSYQLPDTLSLLRFDWNEKKNLNSFYVDKKTPQVLTDNIENALRQVFADGYTKEQITRWIFHSGGTAILDKIQEKIGLSPEHLRHTRFVLKNYGNVSSGSFLFSLEQMQKHEKIKKDELGLMVAMGPGVTIEMALVKW